MRILLVNPANNGTGYFPVGLGYISSSLKSAGYDVHCIDLCLHQTVNHEKLIRDAVVKYDIDVLGTGGLFRACSSMKQICDTARATKPGIKLVLGGGLLTSIPQPVFSGLQADFGVIGEGDCTVVELFDTLKNGGDLTKVDGICYWDSEKNFKLTNSRKVFKEVDLLPFPDYEGFSLNEYLDWQASIANNANDAKPYFEDMRYINLLSSRSCPFSCTFCYHSIGRVYRKRSTDNLFKEIDLLVEQYGINLIGFQDDLFVVKREQTVQFCERIKSYNMKWACQLRLESVDPELLTLMRDSGCFSVSYGIESASKKVLTSMKKKLTVEVIDRALSQTLEARVGIQGNLIFGDIAEDVETVNESLTWWFRNPRYQVWSWLLSTYPLAEIYIKARERGLIKDDFEYACMDGGDPLAHVVNLTEMDEPTFSEMIRTVQSLYGMPRVPAKLLSVFSRNQVAIRSDNQGTEPIPMLDIEVQCSACGAQLTYNRISILEQSRVYCRNCLVRIDTPLSRLRWLLLSPNGRGDFMDCHEFYERGQFIEAHQRATALGQHPDALGMLGTIFLHVKPLQADALLNILLSAATRDPFTPFLQNNAGIALFATGRIGQALLRFQQARILEPDHPQATHNEAVALEALGPPNGSIPFLVPPARLEPQAIDGLRIAPPDIKARDRWVAGLQTNIAMPMLLRDRL